MNSLVMEDAHVESLERLMQLSRERQVDSDNPELVSEMKAVLTGFQQALYLSGRSYFLERRDVEEAFYRFIDADPTISRQSAHPEPCGLDADRFVEFIEEFLDDMSSDTKAASRRNLHEEAWQLGIVSFGMTRAETRQAIDARQEQLAELQTVSLHRATHVCGGYC